MASEWIKVDVSSNEIIQDVLAARKTASDRYRQTKEYKAFQKADAAAQELIAAAVAREGYTVSVAIKPWGVAVAYKTGKAAKASIKV